MKQKRSTRAASALKLIRETVEIRKEITELYKQYRSLSNNACFAASLQHADLKRAVDAIHYFGGGWPKETSKGRMEALLENFVGMYRILDFIGEGAMVEKHLAKFGVTVSLADEYKIEDMELTVNEQTFLRREYSSEYFHMNDLKTVRDLVTAVVMECHQLQGQICQLADKIKDELRPAAQNELEIENAEYDRLHQLVKISSADTGRSDEKVTDKKAKIVTSLTNFNAGIAAM